MKPTTGKTLPHDALTSPPPFGLPSLPLLGTENPWIPPRFFAIPGHTVYIPLPALSRGIATNRNGLNEMNIRAPFASLRRRPIGGCDTSCEAAVTDTFRFRNGPAKQTSIRYATAVAGRSQWTRWAVASTRLLFSSPFAFKKRSIGVSLRSRLWWQTTPAYGRRTERLIQRILSQLSTFSVPSNNLA